MSASELREQQQQESQRKRVRNREPANTSLALTIGMFCSRLCAHFLGRSRSLGRSSNYSDYMVNALTVSKHMTGDCKRLQASFRSIALHNM